MLLGDVTVQARMEALAVKDGDSLTLVMKYTGMTVLSFAGSNAG